MSQSASRYNNLKNLKFTTDDGREIMYKERRFIPISQEINLGQISVLPYERLDNLSARVIDDPLQYWRICDSNIILHPLELQEGKRTVKIGLTTT